MRSIRVLLMVVTVAILTVAVVAVPGNVSPIKALPGSEPWTGTWVTSFQVMNLEEDTANVSVEYYKADGSVSAASPYQVAAGSSINVFQPSVGGLPNGFKGSAAVSSDNRIAVIGSQQSTYSDGGIGNSQYSGFGADDIGRRFYLPNINKRYGGSVWSSRITIQNTTDSAVSGTIRYFNADGTQRASEPVNLGGRQTTVKSQLDNSNIPNNWLGSAIVETTGDVAVVADIGSNDGRVETYNGFLSGSTVQYLPTLLVDYGSSKWNTSFQVMNVGSSTAQVKMMYYASGVSSPAKVVGPVNLGSMRSLNRYQPVDDSDLGSKWIGSVVIESTNGQPIVAVGTQSSGVSGKRLASAYNGVGGGSTSAVLPTVLKDYGSSNYVTSFQIMNVGSGAATVTVKYYSPGNPNPIKTIAYNGVGSNPPKIAPFNSVNRYQGNDSFLSSSWQGSVRVESDQPVVVLGSQNGLDKTGDASGQYNAIPVSAP